MTIKAREFDRLIHKFEFVTRSSDHLLAWMEVGGKKVVHTRRSWKRGDLPMQHTIRKQLWLNEEQLRQAIDCTLTRDGYIDILRDKNIL
ncbi:MAG: hypothetical protein V3S51_05145 [Dehalococcoidia bacterium]